MENAIEGEISLNTPDERTDGAKKLNGEIVVPIWIPTDSNEGEFWKVSVPCHNGLAWSTVLSYLIHADPDQPNPKGFSEDFLKEVRGKVRKYNPFKNSISWFSDKKLIEAISCFDVTIQSSASCGGKPYVKVTDTNGKGNFFDDSLVEAAAKILECEIKVHRRCQDNPSEKKIVVYTPPLAVLNRDPCVIIIERSDEDHEIRKFSFALNKEIGDQLQEEALLDIFSSFFKPRENEQTLEEIYQRDKVAIIYNLPGAKTNLLISLLKNNHLDDVKDIYNQPPFIFEMLSRAGFVTDPKSTDSESVDTKTAFFYAVRSNDFELLYQLYNYAVSCPEWSFVSNRNPTEVALKNFEELTLILLQTKREITELAYDLEQKEKHLLWIEQIILINEFQHELCSKLQNIFTRSSKEKDQRKNAEEQKEILLSIMDVYGNYFNGPNFDERKDRIFFGFCESYSKYFYYIDFLAALKFFDHSFSLKNTLEIEGGHYERIESAFCSLFFLCDRISESVFYKNSLPVLNHLNRVQLQEELEQFKELLETTEGNVVTCLPKKEIDVLRSVPEIKDEFLLLRLKRYLDTATGLKFEDGDEVKVQVMLRSLQILGESLKVSHEIKPTVVESLLVSTYRPEIIKNLCKIRDSLSHYNRSLVWARGNVENAIHFERIQGDLKALKLKLRDIEVVQAYRIRKWVLETVLTLTKDSYESFKNWASSNYLMSLEEAMTNTEDEIEKLKTEFLTYLRRLYKKFMMHFQNHCTQITNCYENEIKTSKPDEFIAIVNAKLECYKCLLLFLASEFSTTPNAACFDTVNVDVCKEIRIALINGHFALPDSYGEIKRSEFTKRARSKAQEILMSLEDLKERTFRATALQEINIPNKERADDKVCYCPAIEILSLTLKGCYYLSDEEKETVCSSVPPEYKSHHDAILKLIDSLKQGKEHDENSLQSAFGKLINVKEETKEHLEIVCLRDPEKGIEELKKLEDVYGDVSEAINKNELENKCFDKICEKMGFSSKTKAVLRKMVKGERNTKDTALYFLKDRVYLLKILVQRLAHSEENSEEFGEAFFNQHKILYSYVRDPEIQAAIEFLIFDCVNLLEFRRPDLKRLWIKVNRLFSGINVRNVLGHGNPLMEAMCSLLDPWDLCNEIVEKVLEIVSDYEAIEAMCLLQDRKQMNYSEFLQTIEEDENDELEEIRKIKLCSHWKDYIFLIPLNTTKNVSGRRSSCDKTRRDRTEKAKVTRRHSGQHV